MPPEICDFQYYKTRAENERLLVFIESSMHDKAFLKTNVRLLKYCLLEWWETEQRLSNWK